MEQTHTLLLEALGAALRNTAVQWAQPMTQEQWAELFQLADTHRVMPMVYQAAYCCPSAQQANAALFAPYKRRAMHDVIVQAQRTQAFFEVYDALCAAGLTPLVVKGVVCRTLYPNPDQRMSGDEDLLLPHDQLRACHRRLVELGFRTEGDEDGTEQAYETSFVSTRAPLIIEVHSGLFPQEDGAYGNLAALFETVFDRAEARSVEGHTLRTLSHTDHMLFLICHAFKHFLHSGFGLRQVCDIALYANHFGSVIDWAAVQYACRSVRAERFAAGLFQIAEQYLTFNPTQACFPEDWRTLNVQTEPLLEDLLCSGIYGSASMSRRHSSRITLSAVTASRKGGTEHAGVLKALFPPVAALQRRFPYLEKHPWLLPLAWMQRIVVYRKETAHAQDNNAVDAVKIGRERTALLKEYDII